jgi:hypothetical protein
MIPDSSAIFRAFCFLPGQQTLLLRANDWPRGTRRRLRPLPAIALQVALPPARERLVELGGVNSELPIPNEAPTNRYQFALHFMFVSKRPVLRAQQTNREACHNTLEGQLRSSRSCFSNMNYCHNVSKGCLGDQIEIVRRSHGGTNCDCCEVSAGPCIVIGNSKAWNGKCGKPAI